MITKKDREEAEEWCMGITKSELEQRNKTDELEADLKRFTKIKEAEAYCAEHDGEGTGMTTLEIISKELPIEVYDVIRRMSDTEIVTKAFRRAQREAISRFVIEVMRQSREAHRANPSEPYVVHVSLMLMKVKEQLDAKELK